MLVGLLFAVGGLTATCSDNPLAQAFFGLPSCSLTLAAAFVGFVLVALGIILMVESTYSASAIAALAASHVLTVPPPTSGTSFCPMCGTRWVGVTRCPKDGTELKAVL